MVVIGSTLDSSPHSPQVVTSTRPDFLPVDEVLSPLKELLVTPGEECHYCFLRLLCRDGPSCGSSTSHLGRTIVCFSLLAASGTMRVSPPG